MEFAPLSGPRATDPAPRLNAAEQARTLLKTAANGYRATKMLDVVPVALGLWAEAERRCGNASRAIELAREAAQLLDQGSISLLNEAPIYVALHDALVDVGRQSDAREAISQGLPRLVTRVHGLSGTPYAKEFLSHVAANAALLAAASGYKLLPPELEEIVDSVA